MMDIQQIKQRFGIIGNSPALNRSLSVAMQVAPTDMNVLITGESGTGKENMPKVIHNLSARKHATYIAVNCGAIPEGTIDSELFGHEKGSFTGAHDKRKGYFEEADGGTIFLDEVAELPTTTQVRLLRVLETGEFLRVGSSKPIKTNVRVVAATNENLQDAIQSGKFREDLFYRLSSVPIHLPALRERNEDIHLIFRKFASEFAEKYRMPTIRLSEEAAEALTNYAWPGNIRQLKNTTEQISIIEQEREISAATMLLYLPESSPTSSVPIIRKKESDNFSERDILYKVLFEMKKDLNELKKLVLKIIQSDGSGISTEEKSRIIEQLYEDIEPETRNLLPNYAEPSQQKKPNIHDAVFETENHFEPVVEVEESLSLEEKEKELITKALTKHRGKRKYAAQDLGISERTLYRKIKEYDLTD
ncbi:MAG: sigma-54 interaction domain-containing protein [Crocinitomicaceae bacterium]